MKSLCTPVVVRCRRPFNSYPTAMTSPDTSSPIPGLIARLQPDAPQRAPGLVLIPLLTSGTPSVVYRSMQDALASGDLLVREVSEGGSVPNLLVENGGDTAVLILDGEELSGAKQNRIVNSSILVDSHSKLVVPVSCTEVGRWGYTSRTFSDSGYIAPRSVRAPKSRAVHENLRGSRQHRSDQQGIWENISAYHRRAGTRSETGSLRDAMEQRRTRLDAAQTTFSRIDGQVGFIAVTSDGFIGFDAVSRSEVYADVHEKLVRSYLAELLAGSDTADVKLDGHVDAFLAMLASAKVERYPSPGQGDDLRIQAGRVRGAALLAGDEVIHLGAFTDLEPPEPRPSSTGARMHRGHWRSR